VTSRANASCAKLDEWRLLTSLEPAQLLELHDQLAALPIGVSVLADLDTIDMDALRAIGPVVMVDVEELRDPALTDAAMFGFEAE